MEVQIAGNMIKRQLNRKLNAKIPYPDTYMKMVLFTPYKTEISTYLIFPTPN